MVRIDKRLSVCVEGDESIADGFDQEGQAIAFESPTAHRSMPINSRRDDLLQLDHWGDVRICLVQMAPQGSDRCVNFFCRSRVIGPASFEFLMEMIQRVGGETCVRSFLQLIQFAPNGPTILFCHSCRIDNLLATCRSIEQFQSDRWARAMVHPP